MSKLSNLRKLLHESNTCKDVFEKCFGSDRGIPTATVTRWDSTLREIDAVISLDQQKLLDVCKAAGHKDIVLTACEWSQLKALAIC